jgi:hypothetical protein
MSDPYQLLAAALSGDGICCQFQTRGQFVISRQAGPVWPNRGNSFWVTHVGGLWYLFTWVPIGYRIPEATDMIELCRTCMGHGQSAMARVPPPIAHGFGLVELSEEEAEAVCQEMDSA